MKGKSTTRQTYFCDDLSIKAKISRLLSISERTFIVSFSFSFNLTGIVSFCHKLTFPLSKNHKIKFQTHFSFSEKSTFLYLNSWVCLIGQAKKRYSLPSSNYEITETHKQQVHIGHCELKNRQENQSINQPAQTQNPCQNLTCLVLWHRKTPLPVQRYDDSLGPIYLL